LLLFLRRPTAFILLVNYMPGQLFWMFLSHPRAEDWRKLGRQAEEWVDRAFEAAHSAFPAWRDTKPSEREAALLRLADLIEENADDLAIIETLDNGKALGPCREIDILGGADLVRYMAGMARHIDGSTRSVSVPGNAMTMTVKEAIGVVSAIVPWNWPFNMSMWKLAAPLAAGCTLVLKTAQQTPLSMMYFTRLIKQAGFPDGVINIVSGKGSEIGDAMAGHRLADKVSFTARRLSGGGLVRWPVNPLSPVTLELGGKSPMLAFEDADLDKLVETTRWSVFFNAGQVCTAGSRLYVHRSRLEEALAKLTLLVESMKLATGLDENCEMGPVISAQAQRDIEGYIERAKTAGIRQVAQGQNVPDQGWFVPPIVLLADDNQAEIVQAGSFWTGFGGVAF
jgi:phenylacetaldehyde dehydrogenase